MINATKANMPPTNTLAVKDPDDDSGAGDEDGGATGRMQAR